MNSFARTLAIGALLVLTVPHSAAASWNEIFSRLEETRGLPAGILAKICWVESRCNPNAQARTSSAAGMFQWLSTSWQHTTRQMHQNRPECGGRSCPLRLEDRFNPAIAAEVTAFSLAQTKSQIGGLIQQAGADMTVGLYMGHFLGIGGASQFFRAYIQNPHQNAAALFPRAAAANGPVFAGGRSLVGVYNYFAARLGQAPANVNIAAPSTDDRGRILVDNPHMYGPNNFDPNTVVPRNDPERDFQTNYSSFGPLPPPNAQGQPPFSPTPPLLPQQPVMLQPYSSSSPYTNASTSPQRLDYAMGDIFKNILSTSTYDAILSTYTSTSSPFDKFIQVAQPTAAPKTGSASVKLIPETSYIGNFTPQTTLNEQREAGHDEYRTQETTFSPTPPGATASTTSFTQELMAILDAMRQLLLSVINFLNSLL
jgi:hypothetical protein